MNPNIDKSTSLSLPEPLGNNFGHKGVQEKVGSAPTYEVQPTPERRAALPPQPSAVTTLAPDASFPSMPQAQPANSPTSTAAVSTVVRNDGAGGTDFSDREAVSKAKAIINETRDDPYRQTDEMAKLKAVYMERRFNFNRAPKSE